METCRATALARTQSTIQRLQTTAALRGDWIVWVKVEDAAASRLDDSYMTSSIGREMRALSSHTVHHFALIAATLQALGFKMDRNFGMAPSTLRYRAGAEAA